MKKIEGYIRDIPGGEPLTGLEVFILDDITGLQIPVGDPFGGSTNPVVTDPQNGLFTWTCELSPGPVRIVADIGPNGTKRKVRSGREVMESGNIFLSDIPRFFEVFNDGVINTIGNKFMATSSGQDITLQTGGAMLDGHLLETRFNRLIHVPTNTTLPTRKDILVLRQHVGGQYVGKQEILLKGGTVNNVDPPDNTDPNYVEVKLWRSVIAQNSGTVTLGAANDLRTYATPLQSANSVTNDMLTTEGALSTTEIRKVLTAPTSGNTPTYDPLSLGELDNVAATAPTLDAVLAWDGTIWKPVAPLDIVTAGDSQTGADDPSTSSQGTYTTAITITFTLPTGTWSVHLWGGALFAQTNVDGGINRRVEFGGTVSDSGAFNAPASPAYDHYPVDIHLTGIAAGSKTMAIRYRVDPGSTTGTAYCRGPYIHCLAWRTA